MDKRPEKPNQTPTPDRWLAFCILIGKMIFIGALWLNWLALTWCFLLEGILVTVSTGTAWAMFLVLAVLAVLW